MKRLKDSQIFRYIMTGGMTTVINYLIYIALIALSINYLVANTVAWLGAVVFAFYANREVVFQSKGNKSKEFIQFFAVRLGTLLVENVLLYILIDAIGLASMTSKIVVSVVTVALNYIACKYSIFKERGVSGE